MNPSNSRVLLVVASVVAAGMIFQLFLRYQYVGSGVLITRIDRLFGTSCTMPCLPTPRPRPTPRATPENLTASDNEAIQLARSFGESAQSYERYFPTYDWTVVSRYTNSYIQQQGSETAPSEPVPIREICYCKSLGGSEGYSGYYYEVHLDTGRVFTILGNRTLEERYGVHRNPSGE
jgi:hypothetical protein